MTRLRGGRVLIDSGYKSDVSTYELSLDKETTKAIVEKGLSVIIIESVQLIRVCIDLIPHIVEDGRIVYYAISNDDGDTIAVALSYESDFSNGVLSFSIE